MLSRYSGVNEPTSQPTGQPTGQPTCKSTTIPTLSPTTMPSLTPTFSHSIDSPSYKPTFLPNFRPSCSPTVRPTTKLSTISVKQKFSDMNCTATKSTLGKINMKQTIAHFTNTTSSFVIISSVNCTLMEKSVEVARVRALLSLEAHLVEVIYINYKILFDANSQNASTVIYKLKSSIVANDFTHFLKENAKTLNIASAFANVTTEADTLLVTVLMASASTPTISPQFNSPSSNGLSSTSIGISIGVSVFCCLIIAGIIVCFLKTKQAPQFDGFIYKTPLYRQNDEVLHMADTYVVRPPAASYGSNPSFNPAYNAYSGHRETAVRVEEVRHHSAYSEAREMAFNRPESMYLPGTGILSERSTFGLEDIAVSNNEV